MCSLPVLATVCFAACVTFCLRMPYVHMYISLLSEPPEFKKRAFPLVDMGVPPWTQGRVHARGVHLATASPFRTVGLKPVAVFVTTAVYSCSY